MEEVPELDFYVIYRTGVFIYKTTIFLTATYVNEWCNLEEINFTVRDLFRRHSRMTFSTNAAETPFRTATLRLLRN